MPIEIEHHERVTAPSQQIVATPEDDDTVLGRVGDRRMYRVERPMTVTKEQYVVRTSDGAGNEERTYWVERNDDDDWHVVRRERSPASGRDTVATQGDLSTEAVRDALEEEYGIELVN